MDEIAQIDSSLEKQRSMQDLINGFLRSLDVRPNSVKTYERGLKQFTEWLTSQGDLQLTRETILAYKNYLSVRGTSALTISSYLVAVRRFFEFAEAEKIFPNIAKGIKGAKRPKGFRKDALTVGQIKELLESSDQATFEGLRNHAILNLLVRTGIRTIELTRADVGDIRPQSG